MKPVNLIVCISVFLMVSCFSNKKVTEIDYSLLEHEYKFADDSNTFIIRDAGDLAKFAGSISPEVDLNKKTVLGFRGTASGCSPPVIEIKVLRDDLNKKYLVDAVVYEEGFCKKLFFYRKVLTTDKIKKNYRVEFRTKNIPQDKSSFWEHSK
ncbi:MAG: hypothetical protein PVF73_12425 [Bacteroidales bacterium]|jgi:hypothetical protein